ncbi:phage tail protein [Myxococcota bacterium]|nr:phage tail protein [Myxococcota bacterium]
MSSIVVDGVAETTRKPGFYGNINTRGARTGAVLVPDSVLLVGTMASSGTAGLAQVFSVDEVRTLAGEGSPLVPMAEAALANNANLAELWVLPVAEAGTGVVAAGAVALTVSSPQAGTARFRAGQREVIVSVASSDTATTLGDAIEEAINADIDFPFSAVNTTGTIALTAKVKGTHGNKWVFSFETDADGVSAAVTQPVNGANDFVLATALAGIASAEFSIIACELNDATSLTALAAHLNTVSGPMEQRPGIGLVGFVGSVGSATTLGGGPNSGRVSIVYARGLRAHPAELAAAMAAQVARYGDDRARPLNGVKLVGLNGPTAVADRLTRTEQESLLRNGCTPLEAKGGICAVVRWVTTYLTNDAGGADDVLLDGMTIRVLDLVRARVKASFEANLAGLKIATVARGPNTTDPEKVRTLFLGELFALEREGQLQNVEANADRLVVELSEDVPGRLNANLPCEVVPGLHVVGANFNLIL